LKHKIGQGTSLDTAIIFTGQMEALARFYGEALGIGPFERSPGHMGCRVGDVYFGFDQVEGATGNAEGGATLWFTVDDLQATFDRAIAMGAGIKLPPTDKPWGARIASVYDPDGNLLGLAQRKG
jgi:predicted enzyme related to lactoylglutathione lyase